MSKLEIQLDPSELLISALCWRMVLEVMSLPLAVLPDSEEHFLECESGIDLNES